MKPVSICLVGCGGMGMRHIGGYRRLDQTGLSNLRIVAVCDIDATKAEAAARQVEAWFGTRPAVYTDVADAIADPRVEALDIATDPSAHHRVGVPALLAGKHVISEKPLGITVRAAQSLIDAAREGHAVLATAENLRRDPSLRLARAVLDAGLLGEVFLMVHNTVGGDDTVMGTEWRHAKSKGAIGLDMAVHYTDIIQYLLGDFDVIFGRGLIAEPTRRMPATGGQGHAGERWITPTGEDSVLALYRMTSGVLAQMAYLPAGPASAPNDQVVYDERRIHGRVGALQIPPHRTGWPLVFRTRERVYTGEEILALVPGFTLDELTTRLFGPGKVTHQLSRLDADACHLAIELHDFADAVLTGRQPEVDGHLGLTAVASILAAYESDRIRASVTMADVMSGAIHGYQDEIDRDLGLLPI